ncbi:MAG: metal ABC transporter permease [Flavobacteriales bacterium]|nr:metal ABC transporter permease [Flavobacteriales bacterium]
MNDFLEFFSFANRSINVVIIGTVILGITSAVVGSFFVLQKRSLVSECIAHSVLPGVMVGFIVAGEKDLKTLLFFATLSGLFSAYLIDWIQGITKLKSDTLIAVILSVFLGVGLMLLDNIQGTGGAAQSGLDHFLFGKAASIIEKDLVWYSLVAVVCIATIIVFYKPFKLISFDFQFGTSIGLPTQFYKLLLTTLTVIVITAGIQIVGVVLMAATLIGSVTAAKYWSYDLRKILVFAALFGAISAVSGAFISYKLHKMPTGPWIVVSLSVIILISILVSPKMGLLKQLRSKKAVK